MTGKSIQVQVNGESRTAIEDELLTVFLARLGIQIASVLIEFNGVALLRAEWEQTRLADGDRMEILRVVAGG